jgi:hypothetical protein
MGPIPYCMARIFFFTGISIVLQRQALLRANLP